MNATIKIRNTLYHNNYDITNNNGRNDNDHHRSQRRQQRQQRQQRQRRQQRHQQRLSSVIRGVHILSNNFVTLEWFSMADCFKAGRSWSSEKIKKPISNQCSVKSAATVLPI